MGAFLPGAALARPPCMKIKHLLSSVGLVAAIACAGTHSTPPKSDGATVAKINEALAGAHRSDEEKARDAYRHPAEMLEFFGLQQDMTVVEVGPGRGWFTAVLAPVLKDKGHLVEPIVDPKAPDETEGVKYARLLDERLKANPDVYAKVDLRFQQPGKHDFGPAGSADMVLLFRELHNLNAAQTSALLDAAHDVLRPGGVLAIEQHRALPDADPAKSPDTGYLPEAFVITTIEAKGFTLDAKSEMNANPKDTKDYPEGVWTLPPSYALKDKDREKYAAIGESDRMTLRFVRK